MSSDLNLFDVASLLNDLTCSICYEYFKNPKTLTCQHSFCSECLEQLYKRGSIQCPQCRAETVCRDAASIPKNTILANLISNLKNSHKAACPECKSITNLLICEHCSQVFCKSCKNDHLSNLVKNLEEKFKKLNDIPGNLEKLKQNIIYAEKEALETIIKRLNQLENEFLSLMQSRKLILIDQISRFYLKKSKEIEKSQENMKSTLDDLKLLTKELKELKEKTGNLHPSESNKMNANRLIRDLTDFEAKISKMELNLNRIMPPIDTDNNKLDFVCEKLDSFEVYMNLIDKIYLSTSNGDKLLLDNCKKSDNDVKYEIDLKTAYGYPFKIEVNDPEISYDELKRKLSLNIDSENVENAILFHDDNKVLEKRCYIKATRKVPTSGNIKSDLNTKKLVSGTDIFKNLSVKK